MSAGLQRLGHRLIGTWSAEGTHPEVAEVVTGSVEFAWLAGEKFLIFRVHYDRPDFPEAMSVLGDTDGLRMHYYDERGIYRLFNLVLLENGWAVDRGPQRAGDFGQRMTFTLDDAGATMRGTTQLCRDGDRWEDDLEMVYRRAAMSDAADG